MASVMFLCLVLILSCIHFVTSSDKIIDMECQSAVGIIGQTTLIICSFKTSAAPDINIDMVELKNKNGRVFAFNKNNLNGDPRFKFEVQNEPSLLLSNTSVSDEGEYTYTVYTDRGYIKNKKFNITVTAKFKPPVIKSWPEQIKNGRPVDLYCNASGGYPAGSIHWFDHSGLSNWTASSTLTRTVGEDNLLHLSSKLSFTSIDSNWESVKCVVLNSKGIVEEERMFNLRFIGAPSPTQNQTNIVAAAVVIGSLTVGLLLLLLLLLHRKLAQRRFHQVTAYPDVTTEKGCADWTEPNELLKS